MTHPCPDCGTPFELEDRNVQVRVGECGGCHRTFTLLPHAPGTPPLAVDAPAADGDAVVALEEDDEDDPDAPVCGNCGGELAFRAADDVTIEVFCAKCDETTRFRAEGAAAAAPTGPSAPTPADDGDDAPRPRRDREGGGGGGGGWEDRRRSSGPPRRFDEAPRARGCRRCGGPIDFQPTEDGGREGVCRNCGNRFRLPPRDDDRGGGGGYRGGGGGGYRGGGGGGGYRGGRSGPPRGGGGYRSGGGRPPPRDNRRRRDDE